jgi:hypothetical protein
LRRARLKSLDVEDSGFDHWVRLVRPVPSPWLGSKSTLHPPAGV